MKYERIFVFFRFVVLAGYLVFLGLLLILVVF